MTSEVLQKSKTRFPSAIFLTTLIGTTIAMWGASWDITSHLQRIPESFFTPSHGMLYLGVGINVIAAIFAASIYKRRKDIRSQSFATGLRLIIIGVGIQVIAGPGDFFWHEAFGLDGLLSPTHMTLALGMLSVLVGAVIGFSRINFHMKEKGLFIKTALPLTYGIFWFSAMWLIFFFVLPVSEGETHNFNPDPYVAIVLSFMFIPFALTLVFWCASKAMNKFGMVSVSGLVFFAMSISSTIFTSENLTQYLPWYIAPIASIIAADFMFNKKFNSKIIQRHSDKIAGAMIGSMFFMFGFPMLSMTFLEVYLYNDVFPYDILPNVGDIVFNHWMMSVPGGIVSGIIGMILAPKILRFSLK
ncbi:hypothetical protein AAA799B03_00494 [Marine Group I thaumarchaeote SCGC AAA799-B03]|uniref:Uncharacterized protein n=1 Tax=Marine Group I thaumarchaeote SCGC AAA799-B03 TaxID=1502289 RepID=A0A087S7V9_9ARCH|nr:hypothetical protein AAA799B03_00494 [Marine Group I thaumarchaeote SCGC AAA799-B03]